MQIALNRRTAKVRRTVQGRVEHAVANSVAQGFRSPRARPTQRKPLGKGYEVNLPKTLFGHFGEVQIGQNKVHLHAGMTAAGIPVPLQCRAKASQILGGLEGVEIVRTLAKIASHRSQLLQSGLIAQAHAAPVVALQEHQRPVKMKTGDRKQVEAAPPEFSSECHLSPPLVPWVKKSATEHETSTPDQTLERWFRG